MMMLTCLGGIRMNFDLVQGFDGEVGIFYRKDTV